MAAAAMSGGSKVHSAWMADGRAVSRRHHPPFLLPCEGEETEEEREISRRFAETDRDLAAGDTAQIVFAAYTPPRFIYWG